MPATDYQSSSAHLASFGRSILSIGRNEVRPMDPNHHEPSSSQEQELEAFQRLVSERLHDLATTPQEDLLSISWVQKLLDAFLFCQEQFRLILLNHRVQASKPPLDRLAGDFFERSVKALDVCNAIRDGIEQVRQWQKHLEIVLLALDPNQRIIGEGQFRRAKKALTDLAIAMLDEKEAGSVLAQRNRSFGRTTNRERQTGHFRSLSWSVSRSWSAARQLQALGNNVNPPRNHEIMATNGLAVPVYTMSSVLLFVMWTLVAAIPCQDRGLQMHFSFPRHFSWAPALMSLHERIVDESKKRDRRNSSGLLKEIHGIEKCTRHMTELVDSVHFPLSEERDQEVRCEVKELDVVCTAIRYGLDPLERQVREAFHRIVRSRSEVMDCLGRPSVPE
ncbi:hypothetical protein AMTRI_Chr11g94430 [Amborella trichopoda]|uniref:R3H domain-containing protein n=1 Tax=Amborella trichopoda TaxID=13333 RepID=W1PSH4_AMBTC|nr:uncharacterized protein LOC18441217 [Amborella trichopoda]ERN12982.1 hypothetical protein AMTR_s00040p00052950 [Amborella trichopoda]|eukprot:XP_006851401.1 uncharacterized protein LOC18441217 [Amborella trichopoda]